MAFQRIVVKIGTSTLTRGTRKIQPSQIVDLVKQICELVSADREIILVSSGAIAAGRELLDYPEIPSYLPAKQMLAAVGQPRLMEIFSQLFRIYGYTCAQVLLTRTDLSSRRGYLNARNTIQSLLERKIIPIINENDAVATEEIRVGDNDNLSALVSNLVEADLLLLLTDQEGMFTGDPRQNPMAELIKNVANGSIPEDVWKAAGGSSTGLGTGGMVTKIRAADLARRTGTTVIIANGQEPNICSRLVNGEEIGTRFVAIESLNDSRKRYILAGIKTSAGSIIIDDGADLAIREGKSLLAVGAKQAKGRFSRGDTVKIVRADGIDVAVGICNYSAEEVSALCQHKSEEIESILGYSYGDELVHRSNLVIL